VRATLTDAIAKGGSTLRDYVDSRGEPGYFQLDYCVYGARACRAESAVPQSAQIRQGGRATCFCPIASADRREPRARRHVRLLPPPPRAARPGRQASDGPPRELAARFDAYGDWRKRLAQAFPRCTSG
jgi:hypothetical protein